MKPFFYVLLFLFSLPFYSQNRLREKDFMDLSTETFDFARYPKNEEGIIPTQEEVAQDGTFTDVYTATNSTSAYIFIYIHRPPFYFQECREFTMDGKLINKGIAMHGCSVEKWLECDENGENCKVVDYEKNRGKFSYNDLLKFLEKQKVLKKNVKNYEDRAPLTIKYSYEQCTWILDGYFPGDSFGYSTVVLDGNTGKILSRVFHSDFE